MSDTREASRELDVEIAAKVFLQEAEADGTNWRWWAVDEDGAEYPKCPQFSTDIRWAFEVVESMRAKGYRVLVSDDPGNSSGEWVVGFDSEELEADENAVADTLPLSICLAALAALAPDSTKSAVDRSSSHREG